LLLPLPDFSVHRGGINGSLLVGVSEV